jgi:hypothetical protein
MAGEGMRQAAHRGLDRAPWHGVWLKFHRQAARQGAEEGDGFGTVMGVISGQVRNCSAREGGADVWVP